MYAAKSLTRVEPRRGRCRGDPPHEPRRDCPNLRGLNTREARSISAIGVDHTGVLIGKREFPRELLLEAAKNVASGILPRSKFSALFLTADLGLVEAWAQELQPSILHLGAAPELLSPGHTAVLKKTLPGMLIMRIVPVVGEESIELARSYDGIADSCCSTATGYPTGRSVPLA